MPDRSSLNGVRATVQAKRAPDRAFFRFLQQISSRAGSDWVVLLEIHGNFLKEYALPQSRLN